MKAMILQAHGQRVGVPWLGRTCGHCACERSVRSIADLTRRDGEALLELAPKAGIRSEVETFPLASANEALQQLRSGMIRGAAVLLMDCFEQAWN